jgi:hypothetical protein
MACVIERAVVTTALIALLATTGRADNSQRVEMSTKVSRVLHSKLTIVLPVGMALEDDDVYRGHQTTSFKLVRKAVHFRLEVADTFAVPGDKLVAGIKAHAAFNDPELANAKVEKTKFGALEGFELQPATVRRKQGRSLIYSAYVVVPRRTITLFRFYVDPGDDGSYAWVILAKKIMASVEIGKREDKIHAQTHHLYIESYRMSLELPDHWAVTPRGELRYLVRQLPTIGSPAASCEIGLQGAVGPTELDLTKASSHSARLWDGTPWKVIVSKDAHQAVAHTTRPSNSSVHLYCTAPDSKALDAALTVMATLRSAPD